MKKRIKKFEKTMRTIIKSISDSGKIPNLITDNDKEALYECIEKEYITGIFASRSITGSLHFDFQKNIHVTYKGLLFLEDTHPERKSSISLFVSIFAAILSAFSVLVSFFAQYSNIASTFRHFLEIITSNQ